MRKRFIAEPTAEDIEHFFKKIPWMLRNGGEAFIRIEDKNKKLMAILAFDGHFPASVDGKIQKKGGNIFLSGASFSRNWFCSEDIYYCIYSYPFIQLECSRVSMIIPSFNKSAIRIGQKAGFICEGIARKYYDINNKCYDAIIMGITKEEAKEKGYI